MPPEDDAAPGTSSGVPLGGASKPAAPANVAAQVGRTVEGVLTGEEMRALTHPALVARAKRTTIFARVDPDQKLQVIRALHDAGAVVGRLGDGINDAPALHTAEIAVGRDTRRGTRAARPARRR